MKYRIQMTIEKTVASLPIEGGTDNEAMSLVEQYLTNCPDDFLDDLSNAEILVTIVKE